MPKFKARGIAVASISYDNVATLSEFAGRESIAYPMLADPDSRAIASFGMVDPDNGPENRADYVLRGFSLPGRVSQGRKPQCRRVRNKKAFYHRYLTNR